MSVFKKCPKCEYTWESRENFLTDGNIEIIGYQANFFDLKMGLFLFNHTSCKTTMALEAANFTDLYDGPLLKGRKTDTDECPSYCLNTSELKACPAQCECAYVRDVIQIVKGWREN
jgi:hypothetical protein